jgi:glycosyltransferase involved in cell wall biosynthesis
LRFRLGAVEPDLRHRFAPITGQSPLALWPHPYGGPPIAEPKSALKRIGFFGHQREEKGERINLALAQQLAADGYAVSLHISNAGYDFPELPGVDVFGFVEDLEASIAACDLVVLPYEIDAYAAKGSGILIQALALGVPVTGPLGTMPGRTIEQYQVGPLFPAVTADAIYATVKHAERNYAAYANNAFRVAQGFSKRNGPAQFAEALLAAAS